MSFTKAYIKFNKTTRRCKELINLYMHLKDDRSYNAPKDMIRGSVVLAVAAFDAYITDVFSEKFISYIKNNKIDNKLIELLNSAGLDTKMALELIKMERPNRRIRKLIEKYYAKYTTQKFCVIDKLFIQYHIKDITKNAAKKAGKASIKRSVEILIERRHEIAHNGDYNSYNKIKDIDENVILRKIGDLELLVLNMDEIICNKID